MTSIKFDKDKIIINVPDYLIKQEILDCEDWVIFYYSKVKKDDKLKVQSILSAFAYYLSKGEEIAKKHEYNPYAYTVDTEELSKYINNILIDIKAPYEYVLKKVDEIKRAFDFLAIHLWKPDEATLIGKKVLDYLQKKYPEIKMSIPETKEEAREINNKLNPLLRVKRENIISIKPVGKKDKRKQYVSSDCTSGYSVHVRIPSINFEECYNF